MDKKGLEQTGVVYNRINHYMAKTIKIVISLLCTFLYAMVFI